MYAPGHYSQHFAFFRLHDYIFHPRIFRVQYYPSSLRSERLDRRLFVIFSINEDFTAVGIDVKTSEPGVVCNLLFLRLHAIHSVYSIIRRIAVLIVIAYEIKIIARIHHPRCITATGYFACPFPLPVSSAV